jgi:signal transduction histidine kinase
MTPLPVARKWRPALGLIVFAVLTIVMALPLFGLFIFRLYDNQLIRETQAELIAQSTVLAAVFAQEVEAKLPNGIRLGAEVPVDDSTDADTIAPIAPGLDLAGNDLLARRPDAQPAPLPPQPAYSEIGAKVYALALDTQKVTLAGFRILDPEGTVIGGREEIGLSLAGIEEVADALRGHYRGALRIRTRDKPPPPIYSISRGTSLRVFSAMPVIVRNHVAGVIYTSRTPSNIFKHLYEERWKFLLAAFAVLGATLTIGLVFSRTVTRPMHELLARVDEIGRGDRAAFRPLKHYGTREFAALSESFLLTAERLSRRSSDISTFAAHLTHELKSPLTSIRGAAELLQDSMKSPAGALTEAEQRTFLANILNDTERLEAMAHRLRDLARAETIADDATASLDQIIARLRDAFSDLEIHAAGTLNRGIGLSPEGALMVFAHLADNAARHNAKTLRINVSGLAERVTAVVSNDGDPISAQNRERVFDAFFTTRRDSGGTGMGLAIAQAVLRTHGGSIRLLSTQDVAFEIEFPAI